MVKVRFEDGPAAGRTLERERAGPITWVAHGPLGLIERYRRHRIEGDVAIYVYDEHPRNNWRNR